MLSRSIPNVTLKTRVRDESVRGANPFRWQDVETGPLFAAKRAVVFALLGAFTPTCTTEQCPAYELLYNDFCAAGINDDGVDEDPYEASKPEAVLEWLHANREELSRAA